MPYHSRQVQCSLIGCLSCPYLDTCHTFSLTIKVVTDHSLTTRGNTTDPAGRFYPRRIIPWGDFPARQEKIWEQLSVPPINCEARLRIFERDTVEVAVQKLIDAVYKNPLLRDSLGLRGVVTFESHTNLGPTDKSLSQSLEDMPLATANTGDTTHVPTTVACQPHDPTQGKGKGSRADQFCIHRTLDGSADVAVVAIEYKPPHKLSQDEVITCLTSEIQPDQDVINKSGKGAAFAAKTLTTAVITQLFSYMISKSIQYGFVCTGQTFVFVHIPDDPTIIYYHVCVPNRDVTDNDENRLHHTAVAQVFIFILQALQAAPGTQLWNDLTTGLSVWPVEYEEGADDEETDDELAKTPPSARNKRKEPGASPYNPPRQGGVPRSPIRARSRCKPATQPRHRRDDDDDGHQDDHPAPPTLAPLTRSAKAATISSQSAGTGQQEQDRPYCTHQCLLGLAFGGPMDKSCLNAATHGPKHIPAVEFRRLLRAQLATDRGADADCVTLYLSGAVDSLFKLRLSAHGYTLVAKGVQAEDMEKLQFENGIYNELRTIQGKHIPVCLGLIDLVLPYYYNGGKFRHFLFLSWGGQSLSRCMDQIKNKASAIDAVTSIFTGIHRLGALHGDAEPRNILYDATKGTFMATDFGANASPNDRICVPHGPC
ncbi:hypothetical protein B0T25DRAFT_588846 [Lasiosphaeria hispida]|uniref:Protein kinase domain-containing protein n=1 Tax=Lasiosphaeria hispida TaxID=260671 RepID=A0AAJ0MIW6_9PEZI|nr:hypothetical protein B0T25DRAFT_588846 [Lasiosphaeria hispida]